MTNRTLVFSATVAGAAVAAALIASPAAQARSFRCPQGTNYSGLGFCQSPDGLGPKLQPIPLDAIDVTVAVTGLSANVRVSNDADVPGKCTYSATPTNNPLLPTVQRNFDVAQTGFNTLTFIAPPPSATYHVAVACRADVNGENIEIGRVEQDVTG